MHKSIILFVGMISFFLSGEAQYSQNPDIDVVDNDPITILVKDKLPKLKFQGNHVAELFRKEITESFKGTLAQNFISTPNDEYPLVFVRTSIVPYFWNGTFWSCDGGTYLRELVYYGKEKNVGIILWGGGIAR